MNRHRDAGADARTADWMMDTVRYKPEALLLLAAGCALMMRSGRRATSSTRQQAPGRGATANAGRSSARARQMTEAAQSAKATVSEYASDLTEQVADTASAYASTAADYAEDARQALAARSARVAAQAQSTMETFSANIREQPLAIVALGLAAGATVAALFPATEIERRTLGPAREAIAEVTNQAGENLMDAADAARERLQQGARDGIKDVARDVAQTFTEAAAPHSTSGGPSGRKTFE